MVASSSVARSVNEPLEICNTILECLGVNFWENSQFELESDDLLDDDLDCKEWSGACSEIIYNIFAERTFKVPITKVLFLDIDGVLVSLFRSREEIWKKVITLYPHFSECDSSEYYNSRIWDYALSHFFDRTAVECLNELIRENPDIGIVISSTWGENRSTRAVREILKIHQFSTAIIGITPHFKAPANERPFEFTANRTREIKAWLKSSPLISSDASFVVLDDHRLPKLGDNFVEVNYQELLRNEDIVEAKRVLTETKIVWKYLE